MSERFPERLRTLRRRKGLSQQALGERLGVSQTSIYKWESGQAEPDMETLREIAAFFGLTMDALCSDGTRQEAQEMNIAVMNRAFRQMTPEEQAKLIEVGRTLFSHAFDPDQEPW